MTEPARLPFVGELADNDDTWRIYRPEWLAVHAASVSDRELARREDASLAPEGRQCWEHFEATYAGRVRPAHARLNAAVGSAGGIVRLELFLPNLRGEFVTRALADGYVAEQGWPDAVVVARNSPEEHELRAYGVRQLPASAAAGEAGD